ncbi:TatD-related DNase [Flavobacterium saliperosum S13]|uniref:TatD DNase family protein n=2 Tax=Flavobacterium saliperosum TaxID=329186 RepID=A0A1G4VFB4_9FLAO|nr:TatD family hydrolase [Flavobacterium saliperosum]ESU25682.1 TatD-related DNase [Flavobacterium saliperosum S13]SCX05872.1 TatD DNase family protein [Flavobacterium saliperosum]
MKYNIHTHKNTHQKDVLEIVNQYPNEFDASVPYFSIGIHPWYIDVDKVEEHLRIIEEKLQQKNCLALGECGLDKRIEKPLKIQTEVFEKQLALGIKYQKPVILHCVSAYQEVIEIKKRLNIDVPMIIHGFSKNGQVAKSLLDNGFYLSFGKYLLRNPELASVFEQVPNERFFLETDTIKENIADVYIKATSIKKLDVEQIISDNFKLVFNP